MTPQQAVEIVFGNRATCATELEEARAAIAGLPTVEIGNIRRKAREARARRISEIEESLARPVEEGADWHKRRAQLERELEALRQAGRA